MKKIALLIALTFSLTSVFSQTAAPAKGTKTTKTETKVTKTETKTTNGNVYVCDSKTSKSYHTDKNCKGLAKCKSTVKEMTKADAEKDGKTACKMCSKS